MTIDLIIDRVHGENIGGDHLDGFCKACSSAYMVLNAVLVDTEWSCHPTPDGRRWFRFHDKNSVHMDGCQRVYLLDYGS